MDQGDRFKVLDGLRALAILLVVVSHATYPFHESEGAGFSLAGSPHLTWFMMNGWTGVELFFILSGFLIAGQLIRVAEGPAEQRKNGLLTYMKRRFMRIAPVYYAVLTVALIVRVYHQAQGGAVDTSYWAGQYLLHIAFMNDYTLSPFLLSFWSMAVEAKFYLIAPPLIFALMHISGHVKRISALALIIGGLLALKLTLLLWFLPPANEYRFFLDIRSPFHMAVSGLMIGVGCRFLWHDVRVQNALRRVRMANTLFWGGTILFVMLSASIIPYFYYDLFRAPIPFFYGMFYSTLISLAFGMMALGLLGGAYGHKIFEASFLRWIALISYSLYLIHPPLIMLMSGIARTFTGTDETTLEWLVTLLLTFTVCLPLATVMYYLIEKPCIDWSHKKKSHTLTPGSEKE